MRHDVRSCIVLPAPKVLWHPPLKRRESCSYAYQGRQAPSREAGEQSLRNLWSCHVSGSNFEMFLKSHPPRFRPIAMSNAKSGDNSYGCSRQLTYRPQRYRPLVSPFDNGNNLLCTSWIADRRWLEIVLIQAGYWGDVSDTQEGQTTCARPTCDIRHG
jgi:hypothetical protein